MQACKKGHAAYWPQATDQAACTKLPLKLTACHRRGEIRVRPCGAVKTERLLLAPGLARVLEH